MVWTIWIVLGAVFGALGVGVGAFGAHALKARVSPENLNIFEIGSRYHMIHALALLAVGLVAVKIDNSALMVSGVSFALGIVLFSGSLYALAITDARWLGMVTPLGGGFFIVGWVALAVAALKPT